MRLYQLSYVIRFTKRDSHFQQDGGIHSFCWNQVWIDANGHARSVVTPLPPFSVDVENGVFARIPVIPLAPIGLGKATRPEYSCKSKIEGKGNNNLFAIGDSFQWLRKTIHCR